MTMRWFIPCLVLVLTTAGGALSGDMLASVDKEGGEHILDAQEIRDLTAGKTFHYTLLGRPRGEEQHFADGRVTWRLPEGTCMHGVWVVQEQTLCYYYGAFRYGCWNVIENEEGYRHSPLEADGTPGTGPSVYVKRISEEPVACAPQQLAFFSP